MNTTRAIIRGQSMLVTVDGFILESFEMKYTLLELGFAVYLDDNCHGNSRYFDWRNRHAEMIPGDMNRPIIGPGNNGLITSDPVLFALAYMHWWDSNGANLPEPVPIPTRREALHIQRNRKILSDFNAKYKRRLPAEWISEIRGS